MKRIAYQGIEGSFSHKTLAQLSCKPIGKTTFSEVYEAVEKGEVDFGLLPIENTLAGTIYETIDLLNEGSLHIIGELHTKVEHSLLALPGASIERVISHPKALAQCQKIFRDHPEWEVTPHYDTAGAAADIAEMGDLKTAAIANSDAAAIYGLEIVSRGIQDHDENYTRFFLIGKQASSGKKGSISFTLDHRAGSLAQVLSILGEHKVNLTYIVSRPIIGKPFEYLFYVDLEMPEKLPELKTKTLKILGTYETISHWRN